MTVELRVGVQALRGWTSVQVSAGIEQAARSFAFTVNGPLAAEQGLRVGQACEVWDDGDRIATGYLETVDDSLSPTEQRRTFGGRSKTCDAVDCSAAPGSRSNLRLVDLFRAVIGDHDVGLVFDDEAATLRIPRHRVQLGESIFDAIDSLARERGYLVTDDAEGRLVLVRPGAEGDASDDLRVGGNVLSREGGWDVSRRYSLVEVKGQTFTDLEVDAASTGAADDPAVTRYRLLIVQPEKPVDRVGALERARWETVSRAGQSVRVRYTVRGWRQRSGALWRPNMRVRVTDEALGFAPATLLIAGVEYRLDQEGPLASLELAPESGFVPYQSPGRTGGVGAKVGRWLDGAAAVREQQQGVLRR